MELFEKITPFEVGDVVSGLAFADLTEELGQEIVYRKETITSINDIGNNLIEVETDFTEANKKEIEEFNSKITDELAPRMSTCWKVKKDDVAIKVFKNYKDVNLKDLDISVNNITKMVETKNADIPLALLETIRPFLYALDDKFVHEAFDVDDEISLTIADVEFTPSVLNAILSN